MSEQTHGDQDPMVTRWDAPSAVRAAIRAAGPSRHILLADFALRLARLGHVTEIRASVAGGAEAAEAVRSVLAELAGPPQARPEPSQAEAVQDAPAETTPPPDGSEAFPGPSHAFVSVREACVKRAGTCLECGEDFEVNSRHAATHKFCSPACRSRHRRRASANSRASTHPPAPTQAPPKASPMVQG
jgi:hypothetical protein